MFDKSAIKKNFSRASADYDRHAKLQESIRKKANKLASDYFPRKTKLLDLGCGTGEFSKDNSDKWDIVGADISYGMCAVAKEKNTKVINADATLLPFNDDSFDCVFSSLLLQWAENPETIIKEILRVLKPDGTAVVTTFVHGTLNELEDAFKVLDSATYISKFVEPSWLLMRIAHIGGLVMDVDEYEHKEYYDDVLSLMRSIKNIGASNKINTRRRGLMTPTQLRRVEQNYKAEGRKISATWNVLIMVIGKP